MAELNPQPEKIAHNTQSIKDYLDAKPQSPSRGGRDRSPIAQAAIRHASRESDGVKDSPRMSRYSKKKIDTLIRNPI
jgi:hypothetical protein